MLSGTQIHSKTLYTTLCVIIPLHVTCLRVHENHARIKDEILRNIHCEHFVKPEKTKCIILINMDNNYKR